MHRLVFILDTGAGPNFIRKSELPTGLETQLSTKPLPNICDANKNPLQMLGVIKLRVHLGHTQVTLKFIVCKTLAPSTIIGAGFCERSVNSIQLTQKLVELEVTLASPSYGSLEGK